MATVLPVRDSPGDAIADPNFPSWGSGARPARPARGVRLHARMSGSAEAAYPGGPRSGLPFPF